MAFKLVGICNSVVHKVSDEVTDFKVSKTSNWAPFHDPLAPSASVTEQWGDKEAELDWSSCVHSEHWLALCENNLFLTPLKTL